MNKNVTYNRNIWLKIFLMSLLTIMFFPAIDAQSLSGNGSESDPYLISSSSDLVLISELVNNDSGNNYKGKVFSLTNDIDLNDLPFTPIGTINKPFCGVFNGNNHRIDGLNITNNTTSVTRFTGIGLFGYVKGTQTTIDNLTISGTLTNNAATTVEFFIGGFVGFASDGILNITNCINETDITNYAQSTSSAGGLVGGHSSSNKLYLTQCGNKGSVISLNGNTSVSALLGYLQTSSNVFSYCYNVGTIQSAGGRACIAVAWVKSGQPNLYNCYNKGLLVQGATQTLLSNNGYYSTAIGTIYNCYSNYGNARTGISIIESESWFSNNELAYQLNKNNYDLVSKRVTKSSIWNQDLEYPDFSGTGLVPYNKAHVIYSDRVKEEIVYLEENSTLTLLSDYLYFTDINMTQPYLNNYEDIIDDMLIYSKPFRKLDVNIVINGNILSAVVAFEGVTVSSPIITEGDNIYDVYYQWYDENDVPITSAVSNSLTIDNINKEYYVKVTVIPRTEGLPSIERTGKYMYGRVVFVSYHNGNDEENNGFSANTPVKTMTKAYRLLSSGVSMEKNIIVLMDNYSGMDLMHSTSASQYNENAEIFNKSATITGMYDGVKYSPSLRFDNTGDADKIGRFLFADTKFEYLNFNGGGKGMTYLYCQGHNITMGEGLTLSGFEQYDGRFTYGTASMGQSLPLFCILGGWLNYSNEPGDEPYSSADTCHIVIKSGKWMRVLAGARNTQSHGVMGSLNHPFNVDIIVDGDNAVINLLAGGQADGSCYINSLITLKKGRVGRFLGGTIGYNRLNSLGRIPSNTFFGNTIFNMEGGTVDELYGGNLGRNTRDNYFYGSIQLNISGGTINNNLYAAGAGGITGYNEQFSSVHSDINADSYPDGPNSYDRRAFFDHMSELGIEQKVEVNISGGTINGNIYGGGYGFSCYLINTSTNNGIMYVSEDQYYSEAAGKTLTFTASTDAGAVYCDTYINIIGGTINGNVYGGGRGSDLYRRLALGAISRNITVHNSATVIDAYNSIAQVYGNTNINILGGNIAGSIFGGSEGVLDDDGVFRDMGSIHGNTSILIDNDQLTIDGDVFGGGNAAAVIGTTNIVIKEGTLNKNVFGGGDKGDVTEGTNIVIGEVTTP